MSNAQEIMNQIVDCEQRCLTLKGINAELLGAAIAALDFLDNYKLSESAEAHMLRAAIAKAKGE